MVDRILDTGYDLKNQGYIFRGLASHFTGTPTERTWLIAPTGSTGFGLSSPVPPGSIGICMYNGSSWYAEILNTLTLDSAPTTGSGNGITSGAVKTLAELITNAIGQLEQSVSDRFTSLELEDTTGSLQAEVLSITLKYVFEGEEETLTSLSILAATAEKAGLMSAADKQKLDAFVTNIRSLRIQDTTAQADQGTEITNTMKWTIGGVTEAITAFTLYAATTSKAGLMSAADKTALDTLIEDFLRTLIAYVPIWLADHYYIDKNTGNIVPIDTEFSVSDKLYVTNKSKLRISGRISGSAIYGVAFYTSSGACLGGVTAGTYTDYDVAIPVNTAYVRFCIRDGFVLNVFVDRDTVISQLQYVTIAEQQQLDTLNSETSSLINYDLSKKVLRANGKYWEGGRGIDAGYWTITNAIFNANNKFSRLETYVLNTGTLHVAIVSYANPTVIEELTLSVSPGMLTINASDFEFDWDNNTTDVCVFLKTDGNSPVPTDERLTPFVAADDGNIVLFSNGAINVFGGYDLCLKFYSYIIYPIFQEIEALKNQGVVSDLQTYINNNRNVSIPAGTYYIDTPLVIPNGTKISGVRGSTVLKLRQASTCISIIGGHDIQINDITFEGSGQITPSSITLSDIKSRSADGTEIGIYLNGAVKSVFIANCRFKNFDLAGIRAYRTSGDLTECFKITDCVFDHNWYGFLSDVRSEYNTCVGCSMNYNQIGCFIAGGNNYISCNHFDKNAVGCVVSGTAGENDSHGVICGSSFNHNTVYALCCIDVNNGFTFSGCNVFDGVIGIENSKGLLYDGGVIAAKIEQTLPRASQVCMIANVIFHKTYDGGVITDTTNLLLKNNHFADGSNSSSINN